MRAATVNLSPFLQSQKLSSHILPVDTCKRLPSGLQKRAKAFMIVEVLGDFNRITVQMVEKQRNHAAANVWESTNPLQQK